MQQIARSDDILDDVFVEIDFLQPVHMMEIKLDLETEDGDEIVTTINNTIHDAK